MRLYEDIYRIKTLMVEDKSIPNMIKTLGIFDAIRYFGGYDKISEYITNQDKVNYIKEKVAELGRGGVSLYELRENPIYFDEVDRYHKQIGFLGRDRAYIDIYHRGHNMGDKRVLYEDLPLDILDEIFRMLLNN